MHHPSCPTTGDPCFISRFWIIKFLKFLGRWADPFGGTVLPFDRVRTRFKGSTVVLKRAQKSFLTGHHTETVTAPPDSSSRTRFQDACGRWKTVTSLLCAAQPQRQHAASVWFWSSKAGTSYPDSSCLTFPVLWTFTFISKCVETTKW